MIWTVLDQDYISRYKFHLVIRKCLDPEHEPVEITMQISCQHTCIGNERYDCMDDLRRYNVLSAPGANSTTAKPPHILVEMWGMEPLFST